MDNSERQALVAERRASGMTAKAWCEAKGIKYRHNVDCATRVNEERQSNQPEVRQWLMSQFQKKNVQQTKSS